jgi:two-component system, sensor histidine kinase and response regulator
MPKTRTNSKDYSEIMRPKSSPEILPVTGDITERKRVEVAVAGQAAELSQQAEELRRSRQALETQTLILQSVLDGMGEGLIAADREGHFLIWNDTAKKLMGREASDLPTEQWGPHY